MVVWHLFTTAPTSGDPLLDWLSRAGAFAVLAAAVVALLRGWVVPATTVRQLVEAQERECTQLRTERDRALGLVYKQAEISNRALEVTEKWSHMG